MRRREGKLSGSPDRVFKRYPTGNDVSLEDMGSDLARIAGRNPEYDVNLTGNERMGWRIEGYLKVNQEKRGGYPRSGRSHMGPMETVGARNKTSRGPEGLDLVE